MFRTLGYTLLIVLLSTGTSCTQQPSPSQQYQAQIGLSSYRYLLLVPARGCAGCVQACTQYLRTGNHDSTLYATVLVADHPTHTDDFESVYHFALARFNFVDSLRQYQSKLGSIYFPTLLDSQTGSKLFFTADSVHFTQWIQRHTVIR